MTVLNLVTVEEVEANPARIIEQVRLGEHVLLVENGVEIARIVPSEKAGHDDPKPKRQGGFWAGKIQEIDPDWWKPDDELADLFEGSESRFDGLLGTPKLSR